MNLEQADQTCVGVQKLVFDKMANKYPVNSFESHEISKKTVREDGVVYLNDLRYGQTYPNSYLDIWYPSVDMDTRPTIVYFHGGGFIFGDKVQGDPLAVQDNSDGVFLEMLKAGFNIVSANYALAPEYRFPVQVHQVNELMSFLLENQIKLELDMDHVILMGGSAGADLTEIYGLVVADSDYANKMNISPILTKEKLKALVIDEAALYPESFAGVPAMEAMSLTWLGEDNFAMGKGRLLDVPGHIQDSYIPAFINSSNLEPWFWASSNELEIVLKKKNLPYEHFYRDSSFGELKHGYLNDFKTNYNANDCLDAVLHFIKKYSV
jgi:acetyl esterase/lipase